MNYYLDPAQEELRIEYESRDDYLRELAAEHYDPCAGYEDECRWEERMPEVFEVVRTFADGSELVVETHEDDELAGDRRDTLDRTTPDGITHRVRSGDEEALRAHQRLAAASMVGWDGDIDEDIPF